MWIHDHQDGPNFTWDSAVLASKLADVRHGQGRLGCLGRSLTRAEVTLGNVLFKARLWERINQERVNERQRWVINRMLEDDFKGHMNTSKYAKLAKCSGDTALRDIQDLKQRGIFLQNSGGGRSTSYRLPDRVD